MSPHILKYLQDVIGLAEYCYFYHGDMHAIEIAQNLFYCQCDYFLTELIKCKLSYGVLIFCDTPH